MVRAVIPMGARKVFSGVIFDVYQWDQELFDGSHATFEAVRRNDSATVIAVVDDKVVVTREENPGSGSFLSLPCGFVAAGEEPLAAAKRELREEAGLASDDWEHYVTLPVGSKISWDEHVFIARGCREVGEQLLDAGERIEVLSYSWDEFLRLLSDEGFRLVHLSLHIFRLKERCGLEGFRRLLFGGGGLGSVPGGSR
ncbi:NUDIX hydrolase [Candidatus Woesearchaeota archaeon]|nr:NUDIX hydrolase [Candidatus Woesearchaeota archaeon]